MEVPPTGEQGTQHVVCVCVHVCLWCGQVYLAYLELWREDGILCRVNWLERTGVKQRKGTLWGKGGGGAPMGGTRWGGEKGKGAPGGEGGGGDHRVDPDGGRPRVRYVTTLHNIYVVPCHTGCG